MPSDCFLLQVSQSKLEFQIFEVVISERFPWLVLNRSRKTCLALQFVRVVICSTAFFTKASLFSKTVY